MNPLFSRLPTTIFETMSALAREHDAVNLGQGFPEVDGPLALREEAARALLERPNQYPPMLGLPELRRAVAEHYGRLQGVSLDPLREVLVTSGATEALAASFLGLIAPGDEVILFEPLYDAYLPLIERAGGVARLARLELPDFRLTREELERVFSPRTRLVVLNTPSNPAATCLSREELELLADFVEASGALVVSDEVWEHVVFEDEGIEGAGPPGGAFTSALAVPRLRARTVKIGSAGKMFALTGWKVGFVCASPELLGVVAKAHQFLTFTTPPALQWAVARGLAEPQGFFTSAASELARSRDRLAQGLTDAGFVTLPSRGTYFLNLDLRASGIELDDRTFAELAVTRARVASIPLSAFYATDPVRHLVRLCFAKTDATLDEAVRRLSEARSSFR